MVLAQSDIFKYVFFLIKCTAYTISLFGFQNRYSSPNSRLYDKTNVGKKMK